MKKLIFMSLEGVLMSKDFLRVCTILSKYVEKNEDSVGPETLVDDRCAKWLKYIIHQTDAQIVVMDHRMDLEAVTRLWESAGLSGEVVDVISDRDPWLWRGTNNHKDPFVVIDPLLEASPVVVKTYLETGLTVKDIHKIVKILNG